MTHRTDGQHVWELVQKIRFCMLVTHDRKAGEMRARPMSAAVNPDDEAIYFLTDLRQLKDDEIEADPNVCLTFADTSGQKYVSITGIATLANDREKIAELWSAAALAWWDSKDDPNIRVLRVMPTQAEYWDGPGSIVTLVKMLTAAVTGGRPELGENRKVTL